MSSARKMITLPMPSDGNCLFSSLASFFNSPKINHTALRRMLVHYIYQNKDVFINDIIAEGYPDIETYCQHMSRDSVWGDGVVISAFIMVFKINVCICFSDSPDAEPTHISNIPDAPIIALLLNNNHYVRIISW